MGHVHVLDSRGLEAAVRDIQTRVVTAYPSADDRDADIPVPWLGAVALLTDTMTLEAWDGATWAPLTGGGGGGGLDIPTADARYVNVVGDTMTGTLSLSAGDINVDAGNLLVAGEVDLLGPIYQAAHQDATLGAIVAQDPAVFNDTVTLWADPTAAMQAATKQYVDAGDTSGVPATRRVDTVAPLSGGGDLSVNRTLAIAQFANTTPGMVPASGGGLVNFLRADGAWVPPTGTGVPTTRAVNTTAPLTGGGDLSADRTLAVNTFGAAQPGVVPSSGGGTANFLRADGTWAAPPSGSGGGGVPVGGTTGQVLAKNSGTDFDTGWAAPGVPTTRTITTVAPLSGGGPLSANLTLAIAQFATSSAGVVGASGGGTANFLRADGAWSKAHQLLSQTNLQASSGAVTAETVVGSAQVVWTAVSSHLYLIEVSGLLVGSVAGDLLVGRVRQTNVSGTQVGQVNVYSAIAGQGFSFHLRCTVTGLTGSQTYVFTIARASGSGTVAVSASAGAPFLMTCTDTGV